MYQNKGYNTTGINYKKEDNIFSPSFLLDTKYGTNSQTDVVKYGNNNNKREYKIDKWLLNNMGIKPEEYDNSKEDSMNFNKVENYNHNQLWNSQTFFRAPSHGKLLYRNKNFNVKYRNDTEMVLKNINFHRFFICYSSLLCSI